jgi:cytochrome P450 family 33
MLFLIFSALLFYFLIHQFWLRRRNLPDGPLPLPIIGNIHQFAFAKRYEHQLLKWKEKYGPIFTVWLGLSPSIMVADYETCVKLFVHNADAFIDRPAFKEFMKRFRGGTYGVTFVSGPCWQEQRRAVLKILRDFGMGKNKIQESVRFLE